MGKNTKASNLGRSLIRDRFNRGNKNRTLDNGSMLHTTEVQDGYDWGRLNLQSVTEESSFQEFLRTAELAGTEFQAEKLNISYVNPKSNVGLLTGAERAAVEKQHIDKKNLLKIPRRPKWTEDMKAADLLSQENLSFLEWRRGLAQLQEEDGLLMTPYEKNVEFWRQLWRVVERSDVVVQIVDARNPLLFRSEDLERYVKEVGAHKMNMILVNKADFLTEEQRVMWAKHFAADNIRVAFFSAVLAQDEIKLEQELEKLKIIAEEEEPQNERLPGLAALAGDGGAAAATVDSDDEDDETTKRQVREDERTRRALLAEIAEKTALVAKSALAATETTTVLSRHQLIELFRTVHTGDKTTEGVTTIGLVGYPNVGKSSTINALMVEKKVSVSATPGKTKHFQTLYLDKDLLLCDCPGLVMPSFVLTKAEMILNGILPIDQMRDHVPAVNVLCTHIPRHVLEDRYGIMIAKPMENEDPLRAPHSEEFLLAYGYNRGFMTANGQPDQSRAARHVLKEYVAGKLLYCHAPPAIEQDAFHTFPARVSKVIVEANLPPQHQRALRINPVQGAVIDKTFSAALQARSYVKGRSNFPHLRGTSLSTEGQHAAAVADAQAAVAAGGSVAGSTWSLATSQYADKPWRQNQKKEKREKLRRKFVHLDQH